MNSDMREDVVEYLLGELSPDKAELFDARLLSDPGLRAEVDRLRPVVGRLEGQSDAAWVPLEPPPLDIAAIVAADQAGSSAGSAAAGAPDNQPGTPRGPALADDPAAPVAEAAGGARKRPRRSLTDRLGLAWPQIAAGAFSALLLLAVGIGVGAQLGGDAATSTDGPVQTVQLQSFGQEAPADASGEVLLTSGGDGSGDQMTLDVSGLKQSGDQEFYEVWLLGDKGELVALGSFRVPPDGSSTIEVPLPVDPETYRYFDVSIQPENGDPQHSGRSVLRGLTNS
jgi:anti-sigma-K factor RskA